MSIKQFNMERKMHILPVLLFLISSSLDNFIVGLGYGIKKIRINLLNNILIALISGAGTFISMLCGKFFLRYIPLRFSSYIGSALLILLSLYFIFDFFRLKYREKHFKRKKSNNTIQKIDLYDEILMHPELIDKDNSSTIDSKEALILGVALSLNNIGLGIGVSIIGLNIYLLSTLSIFFSLFFIQAGFYIGDSIFSKLLEKYASLISGCIILFLGIYSIFH